MEEENQTDLSKIKYCVKGPKGSEELFSKLGLCKSQHRREITKIQNAKGIPIREIITNFIKDGFETSPEMLIRQPVKKQGILQINADRRENMV